MTDMKTYFKIALLTAVSILWAACSEKPMRTEDTINGKLSFASFSLKTSDEVTTKSTVEAEGTFSIFIYDTEGKLVTSTTYAQVKSSEDGITLPAGNYSLVARSSASEVPDSAFETPVYGTSAQFSIIAGQTTTLGSLTCRLLQCKVTVDYNDDFLATVTGACSTQVEIAAGSPLSYAVTYDGGKVSYEKRAGYFAVNNGENTTMTVVFKGMIEGKSKKMTASLTGIAAAQWRQIKFVKKADEEGNATFQLVIDDYISDSELVLDLDIAPEDIIAADPKAPKGDGGITLEFASDCTMYNDLSNIVVPAEESAKMDLRLVATVPGGIKKFSVHIASTSSAFIAAVDAAGGSDLDLINPSADSDIIFQVVPFPHGSSLLGKTSVDFDLSAAQGPILVFPGTHTFTMDITDNDNCKKQVAVKMIVK